MNNLSKIVCLRKHSGALNPSVRQYGCVVKDAISDRTLKLALPVSKRVGSFFGYGVRIPTGFAAIRKGAV